MQWANKPNAGFSPKGVKTWLPVNPNFKMGVNVADQEAEPGSILNFYKAMLKVRKNNPALIEGDYQAIHTDLEIYFAFIRSTGKQRCLVVLNYSDKSISTSIDLGTESGKVVFSNLKRKGSVAFDALEFDPYEILIVELL